MQKITEGVYRLEATGFSNGYLITEDAGLILVDTGPPGRAEAILKEIKGRGFLPQNLKLIALTHFHHDHAGNAAEISTATGAHVYVHDADAGVVRGHAPVPPGHGLLGRVLSPLLNRAFRFSPVMDLRTLPGHSRDFLPWRVIHAPGHTPGSVCLFHAGKGVLVCGDAVNHRGGRLSPPPSLFTMDGGKAWESLRKISTMDFSILLPGHGPPILSGADRMVRTLVR